MAEALTASFGLKRHDLHDRLRGGVFDAAVIGGGIYGALLALEGSVRGQRVVLLERDDFGGGTSFNSLRTIHGGLRYLQFLDVRRALISAAQRRWWLRTFPDLVHPIPCVMPLHGEGLRRPAAFRAAFLLSRLLGLARDGQGRPERAAVLSPVEAVRLVPMLREERLRGAALWHDAFMPHGQRVVVECLRWAEAEGAVPANRMELLMARRGAGDEGWNLTVQDRLTGDELGISTRLLVNAAGPAVDEVAARITGGKAAPILVPTLAWNLLIDRPPISECSLAAKPPGRGRRTYFIHRCHDRMLIGTGHAGLPVPPARIDGVHEQHLEAMIHDVNDALPGLDLGRTDVAQVLWGILPGVKAGADALLMRPIVVDHGARHAAPQSWSVLGVKLTEAPFVAMRFWDALLRRRRGALPPRPEPRRPAEPAGLHALADADLWRAVQSSFDAEWCSTIDDVIWRRTDIWMHPQLRARVRSLAERHGWSGRKEDRG